MSDTKESQPTKDLTDKQEHFCQRYTTHWNATRAAKEAGYSENSAMEQGYQLLQNTSVKSRIDQITEHALAELGVTRMRILQEISRIAFGTMKDLATWTETGLRLKTSDEIAEEHGASIAEVSETITKDGGSLKIKRHDKVKALELLGRHQKLFADRVEHSGPDGKPIETRDLSHLTDEQLEAKILALTIKREEVKE